MSRPRRSTRLAAQHDGARTSGLERHAVPGDPMSLGIGRDRWRFGDQQHDNFSQRQHLPAIRPWTTGRDDEVTNTTNDNAHRTPRGAMPFAGLRYRSATCFCWTTNPRTRFSPCSPTTKPSFHNQHGRHEPNTWNSAASRACSHVADDHKNPPS